MAFLEDDLQVQTRERDGVAIIDLKGDVTTFADTKMNEAYRAATAAGAKQLILNFAHSNFINSAGIAILIHIVTNVNRSGQKLAMVGLNDHFQKIFRMVGLAQYAELYDDEEQAIAALTKKESV